MRTLYDQFNQLLELTPMSFFREQHDTINWNVRILGILGQKASENLRLSCSTSSGPGTKMSLYM